MSEKSKNDIQPPVVIVISHGHFCEELIRSAAMIYGKIDRIEALPLDEGIDPDDYLANLEELIDKFDSNVLVCVDIVGGTPFNSLIKAAHTRKLSALAGINMPMLIEVLCRRGDLQSVELAEQVCEACASMPTNLTSLLEKAFKK
jgi:mannose/fructose/sorbose-specific phosphotransferase system IIA component